MNKGGGMRLLGLLALGLLALIGFSFAILNAQSVSVDYYIGTRQIPLSLLLVGTLIVGIFIGMLLLLPSILRLKFIVRRTSHEGIPK
jgi:putative membrane protein